MGNASSAGAEALLALDGIAQIGGLTMFVYGLASPKTSHAAGPTTSRVDLSIVPLLACGASGAWLVATF
jgi:hypothetical protein